MKTGLALLSGSIVLRGSARPPDAQVGHAARRPFGHVGLLIAALLPILTAGCSSRPPDLRPWKPQVVVLVAFDTCRADHLGAGGYRRPTSPNLDRIAAAGTYFEHAYSQSNESLFSYGSIFTGRYPRQVTRLTHAGFRVPPTAITLASLLRAHGIRTAACVAGGPLDHSFGFARGFDDYADAWWFGSFFDTFPPGFTRLQRAATSPAPLFLFLHGYDLHEPYYKPMIFEHLYDPGYHGVADRITRTAGAAENVYHHRWYRDPPLDLIRQQSVHNVDLFDPMTFLAEMEQQGRPSIALHDADLRHLVAAYDGALTYGDTWIGLLLGRLEQSPLRDRTLLVIFGDHGEELGEHGSFGHRVYLSQATLHVPLILWAPGHVPARRRVPDVVELRSLMPTLLDYFGVAAPPGLAPSLRPRIEGRSGADGSNIAVTEAEIPQACITTRRWRLVYRGDYQQIEGVAATLRRAPLDAAHFELYDLASDPVQRHNLMGKGTAAEAASLRAELARRLQGRP